MTPRAIVDRALRQGLDAISICDHNSARNAGACIRAASGSKLLVIPGLEITTSEEVHILGLFDNPEDADSAQDEIYARLYGLNDENAIGVQAVVNEFDEVEDIDDRLLIGATTLSSERVIKLIHSLGGLAVASHVDRSGFGIFSQLGFIPPGLELDALEVSPRTGFDEVRLKYRQAKGYPLITSSDAHYLDDIGAGYTEALLEKVSFEEIALALRGESNRRILRQVRKDS
jgi:predicted metal-dependent phosphoesterase TrpH